MKYGNLDCFIFTPHLLAKLLWGYGLFCFRTSTALYRFMDTVNALQDKSARRLGQVWDWITLWRELKPVQSRPAVLFVILKVIATSCVWEWHEFAAFVILTFFMIASARIGDVLKVHRRNLVSPRDLLEEVDEKSQAFVSSGIPKIQRRGGTPRRCACLHTRSWAHQVSDESLRLARST